MTDEEYLKFKKKHLAKLMRKHEDIKYMKTLHAIEKLDIFEVLAKIDQMYEKYGES